MKALRPGTAVVLAGAALVVGGCVEFDGKVDGKQISKDEVRLKFAICDDIEETCNPGPMAQRGGQETRVLMAFRVPKGTKMPKDFRPKKLDVDFTGSPSYTSEMNDKAPRKDAEKWHGYISEDISGESADRAKFKLVLGLPKDPGKTFKYRPAVGFVDGMAPTDDVTCAEKVTDSFNDGDTEYQCVDDPEDPAELRKSLKIELD